MLGCFRTENVVGWALDPCPPFNTLPAAAVCGLVNLNTLLRSLFKSVLSLGSYTLDEECTVHSCRGRVV